MKMINAVEPIRARNVCHCDNDVIRKHTYKKPNETVEITWFERRDKRVLEVKLSVPPTFDPIYIEDYEVIERMITTLWGDIHDKNNDDVDDEDKQERGKPKRKRMK